MGVEAIVTPIVLGVILECAALHEAYSVRNDEQRAFGEYMGNVGAILESIKARLPEYAAPVVKALGDLLARAREVCDKYSGRSKFKAFWNSKSEADKLKKIMNEVQQFLALLTVCAASEASTETAISELHTAVSRLHGQSADTKAHLENIEGAVRIMSGAAGTGGDFRGLGMDGFAAAPSPATASDVGAILAALQDSGLRLSEAGVRDVEKVCSQMQETLGRGVDGLQQSVRNLQASLDSFGSHMIAVQNEISQDVKDIKRHLAESAGVSMGDLDGFGSRLVLAVEQVLQRYSAPVPPAVTKDSLPPQVPEDKSHSQLAKAIRDSVQSGHLQFTSCLVKKVPFMLEGPLRPVDLPCCHFTVSHAGAQELMQTGRCSFCNSSLTRMSVLQENEAVAQVVAAERHGISPPLVAASDIELDEEIGRGGEGSVHRGKFKGKDVAVKRVAVGGAAKARDAASLRALVATTFMAGLASEHVCKMLGVCWTEKELWLLMELCQGSLADLVIRTQATTAHKGLPPMDTVVLGLMLTDALSSVHRSARSLHLDVKPENVLLVPGGPGGHAAAKCSVRLSDFGLSERLPSCVRTSVMAQTAQANSVVQASRGHTPGYAAPEQLSGQGRRASDVYALGATLKFAATGVPPFDGANRDQITFRIAKGERVDIPVDLQPPQLQELLVAMTDRNASARPPLSDVAARLHAIYSALHQRGEVAHYLEPVWGIGSVPHFPSHQQDPRSPQATPPTPQPNIAAPRQSNLTCARAEVARTSQRNPDRFATKDVDQLSQHFVASTMASGVPASARTASVNGNSSLGPAVGPSGSAPMWPVRKQLADKHVSNGLFGLSAPPPRVHVSAMAAMDFLGAGLAHELGLRGCMLLGDSCNGVQVKGNSFQGGVVVCSGSICDVTFTDTTFRQCSLVALSGATVQLINCTFLHPTDKPEGISILGSGDGTTVRIQGGSVAGGAQGVGVHGGASLEAWDVLVTRSFVTAFEVKDAGSKILLENCSITELSSTCRGKCDVRGLFAHSDASATAAGLTVRNAQWGVCVERGAQASLTRCAVSGAAKDGIKVCDAASASLNGCSVLGAGGSGVVAAASGTTAYLEECEVTGSKHHGLLVSKQAQVDASGCVLMSNMHNGVLVSKFGVLRAADCSSEKNTKDGYWAQDKARMFLNASCSTGSGRIGCGAGDRAFFEGEAVDVHSSGKHGFAFWGGVTATLKDSSSTSAGVNGIYIVDSSTSVTVDGASLQDSGKCGVRLNEEAKALMTGVHSVGHRVAGFKCNDMGSKLVLQGCRSEKPSPYDCGWAASMPRSNCT